MQANSQPSTLVIGFGNPARGDDGLAAEFIERLARMNLPGLEARWEYQLCVEDAVGLECYRKVVFVDASFDVPPPFQYSMVTEKTAKHLDTHSLSPGALIYLAEHILDGSPPAWMLAIRGYDFRAFEERLTPKAQRNLSQALTFFVDHVQQAELVY